MEGHSGTEITIIRKIKLLHIHKRHKNYVNKVVITSDIIKLDNNSTAKSAHHSFSLISELTAFAK